MLILLPILVPVLNYVTIMLCIAVGLLRGSITSLPLLSELGYEAPQSMMFSFGLSITAFFIGLCAVIRSIEIDVKLTATRDPLNLEDTVMDEIFEAKVKKFQVLNAIAAIVGLIFSISFALSATFSISYSKNLHWSFALSSLLFSVAYMIISIVLLQGIGSHQKIGLVERTIRFSPALLWSRIGITILALITGGVTIGLVIFDSNSMQPSNDDWEVGVVQYSLNFFQMLFFASYIFDFKDLTIQINDRRHNQYSAVISLQQL
eukprot:TRINITY_DN953_c0_g3_i2.p1 TRINITY_DN953_c0_g3~~TRINITY_DN953_c0_g3_i2.p1  ORF type:complete len:262 (+),score=94.52 TRINITY_DN953_c0_g3_i2:133-918(+)